MAKISLDGISRNDLVRLSDDRFRALAGDVLTLAEEDRKVRQILYYKPVSERAMKVHESKANLLGVGGGNGSSKTESVLVEIIACATGVFPDTLKHLAKEKFRGPLNCRVVVESLTAVLKPVIMPKLMWFKWTGTDMPGGDKGHWGWVPKDCLIDANWEKSWSEQLRTLTVLCRNPENYHEVMGHSTIQFMSHDNDPSDFASGDFHIVMLDEPPRQAIFRENQARTMRVNGRLILAMTWPDDPAIPVDWIYDEIYDKANTDDSIDWIELLTTENMTLDQEAITKQMEKWDEQTRKVRIEGKPIRFSNRIHPLFTDINTVWSFKAGQVVSPTKGKCPETGSSDIDVFNHVREIDVEDSWPVVQILDPHPRKPHMWCYAVVLPSDDYYIIEEGLKDDTPLGIREEMFDQEAQYNLYVKLRLIDPNMGRSPASAKVRGKTWQDEFDEIGLHYDLADDSSVGRARVNEFLKPDPITRIPRIHVSKRCTNLIHQMKRYAWDEYKRSMERDLKQKPREKNDDFPTMLKYLMNYQPTFRTLLSGHQIIKVGGARKRGY